MLHEIAFWVGKCFVHYAKFQVCKLKLINCIWENRLDSIHFIWLQTVTMTNINQILTHTNVCGTIAWASCTPHSVLVSCIPHRPVPRPLFRILWGDWRWFLIKFQFIIVLHRDTPIKCINLLIKGLAFDFGNNLSYYYYYHINTNKHFRNNKVKTIHFCPL